ncbi:MAG: substrate-binding domain-containing protein [Clostridia bacterium]|nr:substrate-binding domain-containing protein [Clostridia bacterium]
MKKVIALVLVLILALGACALAETTRRYTFVCPLVGNEYFALFMDGVKEADEEFGCDTQMVGSTTADQEEMLDALAAAVAAKVDGILMPVHWPDTQNAGLLAAKEAGIPVVTVDADDEGSGRLAFAGTNPYEAGYKAGEAMVEGTGGTAKIAVLTSGVGSGGKLDQELDGFNDAIKDYDMEVVTIEETTGDLLKAVEKTQALVLAYPEVNGIYCLTTYDIQGAAKVVQENGLDNICVVGYDDGEETLNYIRSGAAYATIVQDPKMMGYIGVKLLEQINNGETLEETNIDTGTITVTKENVDSYK